MRGRPTPGTTYTDPSADAAWPVREPIWCGGHTVWNIGLDLEAARRRRCLALLAPEERARADRFLQARDRDRYIVSHAALRTVLAGVLGTDPSALAFRISQTGRPRLAGAAAGRLDFNLSHSGAHALVALSTTARIGVDVEVRRPLPDALRIARTHFHTLEIAALVASGSAPPHPGPTSGVRRDGCRSEALGDGALEEAFFACWTAKEAFVKAVGAGLSMPLAGFAVSIPPAPSAVLAIDGDRRVEDWTLTALAPAPGVSGAVAIEAPRAVCVQARLPLDWADRLGG